MWGLYVIYPPDIGAPAGSLASPRLLRLLIAASAALLASDSNFPNNKHSGLRIPSDPEIDKQYWIIKKV
jgi:hypothetical protein